MKQSAKLSLVASVLLLAPAFSAQAAHLSNSRAELAGAEGSGIAGKAIVNYVKGQETWTANASVNGLQGGYYVYAVRLGADAPTIICDFTADGGGVDDGCSNSQFDLGGFGEGLIMDEVGNIIASGFFVRRGGQRVGG